MTACLHIIVAASFLHGDESFEACFVCVVNVTRKNIRAAERRRTRKSFSQPPTPAVPMLLSMQLSEV